MGQTVELTLTLAPELLAASVKGERFDIIARLQNDVPSLRHLSGNRNFAVSVSIDADQEPKLRTAADGFCTIAPRQYVEFPRRHP